MIISEKSVLTVAILGTVERAKVLIFRVMCSTSRIAVGYSLVWRMEGVWGLFVTLRKIKSIMIEFSHVLQEEKTV